MEKVWLGQQDLPHVHAPLPEVTEGPETIRAFGLDEDLIAAQQGLVRGQLIGRLETLWEYAMENLHAGERPDPRFAELGVRILDRIAKLYRLQIQPAQLNDPDPEPVEARDRVRALVLGQLEELERRQPGQ